MPFSLYCIKRARRVEVDPRYHVRGPRTCRTCDRVEAHHGRIGSNWMLALNRHPVAPAKHLAN